MYSQSTCGIGIVRDYYRLQKFNVMEIAKAEEPGFKNEDGRVKTSTASNLIGEEAAPAVEGH